MNFLCARLRVGPFSGLCEFVSSFWKRFIFLSFVHRARSIVRSAFPQFKSDCCLRNPASSGDGQTPGSAARTTSSLGLTHGSRSGLKCASPARVGKLVFTVRKICRTMATAHAAGRRFTRSELLQNGGQKKNMQRMQADSRTSSLQTSLPGKTQSKMMLSKWRHECGHRTSLLFD